MKSKKAKPEFDQYGLLKVNLAPLYEMKKAAEELNAEIKRVEQKYEGFPDLYLN